MADFLTFGDVAERLKSGNAKLGLSGPYWNTHHLEGSTLGFYHFCEWFEVNIHDAQRFGPEDALKLLEASPKTRLDNSDADNVGASRWFGGAWVNGHHVRVWYNPQVF